MTTAEIVARFGELSALVVGDICLDRWCTYEPAAAEPSRETGIPRVAVVETQTSPGAGGTVAANLAALGARRVAVLGAIGNDGHGFELRAALSSRSIEHQLLVEGAGMQTFTYTKLLNAATGVEDLPRVDFIATRALAPETETRLIDRLRQSCTEFEVILVADQAETSQGGAVTPRVREMIIALAREHPDKVFWVDSRMRAELFRDVIVKPNEREAAEASQRLLGRVDLPGLQRALGTRPLFVTLGSRGAAVYDSSAVTEVPTPPVEQPVDICGAGDSFSAGAALTYAITGSAVAAARIGNLVASVTIMKKGTGTATREEILA